MSPVQTPNSRSISNIERSEDFSEIYATNVMVRMSPWDLTLKFLVSSETQHESYTLLEKVSVAMSPNAFKATALALSHTVAAYEAQFGEIPLHPALVSNAQTIDAAAASLGQAVRNSQTPDQSERPPIKPKPKP